MLLSLSTGNWGWRRICYLKIFINKIRAWNGHYLKIQNTYVVWINIILSR